MPSRLPFRIRILTVCLIVLAAFAAGTTARAFHQQGVGNCNGCHIMHASEDGQIIWVTDGPLLLAPTASDVCLICHGGADGVMGPNPLVPPPERGAGNFTFQLEDNVNDAPDGLSNPVGGHASGHSVIAPSFGLDRDPDRLYSPGGNFPSDRLECTSCHDPHGNRNFRMLHGAGPIQGGEFTFFYPAPEAVGIDCCSPSSREAVDNHTAYRSGMSQWCANCHGNYLDENGHVDFEHPTDDFLETREINQYNRYNGASSPGGGTAASAYIPEVAFEDPAMTVGSTAGPLSTSRIMCLTCHRAHGSSAREGGRWDFYVNDISQDGLVSGSYPLPSPYSGGNQSQLCRKCHNQNHGQGQACVACHAN